MASDKNQPASELPPDDYLTAVEHVSCFSCEHTGPFRFTHAVCVRCGKGPLKTPQNLLIDRKKESLFIRLPKTDKFQEEPVHEYLYLLKNFKGKSDLHFVLDNFTLQQISIDDLLWIKNLLNPLTSNNCRITIISPDGRTRALLRKENFNALGNILGSMEDLQGELPDYPVPSLNPDQMAETVVFEDDVDETETRRAFFDGEEEIEPGQEEPEEPSKQQDVEESTGFDQKIKVTGAVRKAQKIFEKGDHEKSKSRYEEALSLAEDHRQKGLILLDRAIQFLKKKDTSQALKDLNRCLELGLESPRVYFNRGLAQFLKRNYNEALEDFSTAITLKPDYFKAYHNRVKLLTSMGRFEEALSDTQQMVKLKPDDPLAQNAHGLCLLKTGNVEKGKQLLKKVMEIAPDWSKPYYNMACVHAFRKNEEEALDWLEKAIDHGYKNTVLIEKDHDLDILRDNPRFKKLKRRMEEEI